MKQFTVLVPTHDHADTLWFSLGTVLAQTVQDFEIIVVGDGAVARTGEIVGALAENDSRIRYFPRPKGERYGEASRHEALASAQGRYVAYQCDDDLWFPDHLETLAGLLADHDLAHTMQISVTPGGKSESVMFDAYGDPNALERMRRNEAGFGLETGGHTLEAYRRLPHGWQPAPKEVNSDLYFWLQFLEQPWCRYASHKWPDVIHFAAIPPTWSAMRRTAEVASIARRLPDPAWRDRLVRRSLGAMHDRGVVEMRQLLDAIPTHAYRERNRYAIGERLAFSRWGDAYRYPVTGTYAPEGWGTWLRGAMRIRLPLGGADHVDTGALSIQLELMHLLGKPAREVSRVRIAVNDDTVAEIEEHIGGLRCYDVSIPRTLTVDRSELVIEIEGKAPATPCSLGMNNDDRELTVGIVSLSIHRSPAEPLEI